MATKLEQVSKEHHKKERRVLFIERFIAVLGDSREWEFSGEVIESKRPDMSCVCGHAIQTAFVIVHKQGKKSPQKLGSECINHFAEYNPDLYNKLMAGLESHKAKLNEARKAAKKAADDKKASETRTKHQKLWDALCKIFKSYRDRGEKAPYDIWYAVCGWKSPIKSPNNCPTYARTNSVIRWHSKQCERIQWVLDHYEGSK